MLNFETLEELNLSSNWFGMAGLDRFKTMFSKFKKLRILNMGNSKLCIDEGSDKRPLRDVLTAVGDTIEELYLSEN